MIVKFSTKEFCIESGEISQEISDKIWHHHILPIAEFRNMAGFPIWPSQKSGYRSVEYEQRRGRAGTSEHCFKGMGAVDWACDPEYLDHLLEYLIGSDYKRVCYYPTKGFIHCDYKGDRRQYFNCYDGMNWIFKGDR